MNAYAIGSDSPRWWWPMTAAGVAGTAAVAAILVIPTTGSTVPDTTTPNAPPALTGDPWVTTTDPSIGRPCFALRVRWNTPLQPANPRCSHRLVTRNPHEGGMHRPGLDSRP